jgi:lipopolysaccharide transport system ATP-binding protein
MSSLAIKVQHLVKQYPIYINRMPYLTLRESVSEYARNIVHLLKPVEKVPSNINIINALDNISFDVNKGEIVGIIGRNGAGKSTLLKILTRITKPTSGFAITSGSIGSMLEVGTGFHLELTGRENIYVNGAILGMRKKEIDRKFDDIVSFSGVEKFLDTPVKKYSSGMQFRLAFSVAAYLQTDILLVDEVLAVGDYAFQKMCLGKMSDVSKEGRTVLFVSHNMNAISQLCQRTLVIDQGKISNDGKTQEAINYYLQQGMTSDDLQYYIQAQIAKYDIDPAIRYIAIRVMQNTENLEKKIVISGQDLEIEIKYEVLKDTKGLRVFLDLIGQNDNLLFRSYYDEFSEEPMLLKKGRYTSKVIIPRDLLAPKEYELRVLAEEYNRRVCSPEGGIRIPISVESIGMVNRANFNSPIRGELAPVLKWNTEMEPGS